MDKVSSVAIDTAQALKKQQNTEKIHYFYTDLFFGLIVLS